MPSPHSFDPREFDPAVRPADDFFAFVNGKWLKENPIPPEESRWGSFDILRREAEENLKKIVDDLVAMKDVAPGSDAQKIRDFYLTGVDAEKCNRLGAEPLTEIFAMIDAVSDGESLARAIGSLHRLGVTAFWTPFVEQDEKKSEVMALHLYQGGLGLPDRDYYLNDDEKSREIRGKYLQYIEQLGSGLRRNNKDLVMQIETRLAQASRTRVALRDVEKQYNKMTLAEVAALTPNMNWRKYFEGANMAAPQYAIVGQPEFFEEVSRVFAEVPLEDLKIYLRWHALNSMTSFLTEEIERQTFDFYGRTFRGATEMKPRWRRVLDVVNAMLDEALGKLYVERHFSGDAKQKINELVDRLTVAYRARIEKLDWMGDETKQKALAKLATFSRKLGYPDKWKDFSAMTIGAESYADNGLRAAAFEFDRQMKKVGSPVDRSEWLMPPQMVNAYYMPPMNEIAFPAAILQPPFFDPAADDALNFGGIGSVIGHELTHGFDDQGALFDPQGNLKNWWTEDDKKRFDEKAARLIAQFDAFEPLPGVHVNGKLTLGENIADLGGLLIALDALHLALAEKSAVASEKIDGLTPEQRFFANYAVGVERGHAREERMRLSLQTDPHAPSECRVNGPLANIDAFYEAFEAKPGDKLWREPDDRVRIW
jgi:predicted metalloendopeptidase